MFGKRNEKLLFSLEKNKVMIKFRRGKSKRERTSFLSKIKIREIVHIMVSRLLVCSLFFFGGMMRMF